MDNSIYIALSRQLALLRDMDVTANNIANVNTTGYKAEHLHFTEYLTQDNNRGVRNPAIYAQDIASYRDTRAGSIQVTNNPLDVAIKGDGFFMVSTPLGNRYTRAGSFQIGTGGTLVNPDGYPVLNPSGQPIVFPEDVTAVEIGSAGNIKVNGTDFDSIGVVRFENEHLLERAGHTLFKTDATPQPAIDSVVAQGAVENANVQPVSELTRLIKISRSINESISFVSSMYELQRKASNTWAQQA